MEGPPDEEESEEARPARPAQDPGAPTMAEYDMHMLAHFRTERGARGAPPDASAAHITETHRARRGVRSQ